MNSTMLRGNKYSDILCFWVFFFITFFGNTNTILLEDFYNDREMVVCNYTVFYRVCHTTHCLTIIIFEYLMEI